MNWNIPSTLKRKNASLKEGKTKMPRKQLASAKAIPAMNAGQIHAKQAGAGAEPALADAEAEGGGADPYLM